MFLFTGFSFFGILANTSRLLGGIVLSTSIGIFKLLISSVPRLRYMRQKECPVHWPLCCYLGPEFPSVVFFSISQILLIACFMIYCLVVLTGRNRKSMSIPSFWRQKSCPSFLNFVFNGPHVILLCAGTWNWKAVAIGMKSDFTTAPAATTLTQKCFLTFWLMISGTSSP